MTTERNPPGPVDSFNPADDLLVWLSEQFRQFGDIYRASIYGANVYVISDPKYAEHVLLKNWQNYTKGQAIKRVALLLGKGLMVSEGDFWISQRRMVQPAFHRKAIGALTGIIAAGNRELLATWEQAAREKATINVTRDLSRTVLQVVLLAIFGDDYAQAAPRFNILSDEPERSLQFADAFRPLAGVVIHLATQRRAADRIGSDILGMLMQSRDREGAQMSDTQLAREIMTLVVAGHETTASVLNWTWYLLAKHPSVEQRLTRELQDLLQGEFPTLDELPKFAYTRQVIEEVCGCIRPAGS